MLALNISYLKTPTNVNIGDYYEKYCDYFNIVAGIVSSMRSCEANDGKERAYDGK